jgi:uncharacterized membrane protein
MERMLAVVVDSESRAHEACRAFESLADLSEITIQAMGTVVKNRDGATVTKIERADPQGTLGGTAVGSLLGMLAGPVGLAIGAASGFLVGATTDFAMSHVGYQFVADVERALEPGKAAVVAAIDEESTEPVDERMRTIGAVVIRRAFSDVADAAYERETAAAPVEAEGGQTPDEHKGKLRRAFDRVKVRARTTWLDRLDKDAG